MPRIQCIDKDAQNIKQRTKCINKMNKTKCIESKESKEYNMYLILCNKNAVQSIKKCKSCLNLVISPYISVIDKIHVFAYLGKVKKY